MNTILSNNTINNYIDRYLFTIDIERIDIYLYCIQLLNTIQNKLSIEQNNRTIEQNITNEYLYEDNLLNISRLSSIVQLFSIECMNRQLFSIDIDKLLNNNNNIEYKHVITNMLNINKLGRSTEPTDSEGDRQTTVFSKFFHQKYDRK